MRLTLFSAVALALVANLLPYRQGKVRPTTRPRPPAPPAGNREARATYRSA